MRCTGTRRGASAGCWCSPGCCGRPRCWPSRPTACSTASAGSGCGSPSCCSIYLVLAFPSGRLVSRTDRLLFRAGALVVALYLVSALLGGVPGAEPVGQLRNRLPGQRVHAAELRARLRRRRAHAGSTRRPACSSSRASRCSFFAAWRSGSSLMRVELVPVLAAAVVRMVATAAFLLARGADSGVTAHRSARFDRAAGDARRIGRVPDRARAFACPRRAGAGQAERGSGPTERGASCGT